MNSLFKLLAPGFLVGIELHFLFPLLNSLWQMQQVALAWPHLVADSAVFLNQPELSAGLEGLRGLFIPVNEHRLVISRFVAVLPLLTHRPIGSWSVMVSMLLLGGCIIVFNRCLFLLNDNRNFLARLVVLLAGTILMLNPWQAENLIWDINLTWFFHNFLLLFAVSILLSQQARVPIWFDVLLPPLAIFNGGQGYAVLLAVGFVRLALFGRRLLMPIILVIVLLLDSLLPSGHQQASSWGFSFEFLFSMLNNWWPMAGVWTLFCICLIGFQVWFVKFDWNNTQLKQFCIAAIPIIYGFLFSVSVDLSRSSMGLLMANRESYITPLLMIGIGFLLVGWKISNLARKDTSSYLQVAILLLPLIVLIPSLEAGFSRARFFQQQRRMLNEQDRRITWFHCLELEQGSAPSNCPLTPLYDRWDLIRRAFIGKKYVYIAAGKKSDLQAQNELMQQAGADLNRRYLMKKQANGVSLIVARKDGVVRIGDQLMQKMPGEIPRVFKIKK